MYSEEFVYFLALERNLLLLIRLQHFHHRFKRNQGSYRLIKTNFSKKKLIVENESRKKLTPNNKKKMPTVKAKKTTCNKLATGDPDPFEV